MLINTETVTITRQEYRDLIDARDHAVVMRDVAAGAPTIPEAEMDAFLAAPTPLAFFRSRSGLTQAMLAEQAGVAQGYLSQMENGRREGSVTVVAALAKLLGVRMEDLVGE